MRGLQNKSELRNLLTAVIAARNGLPLDKKPPILLKLAPDLGHEELIDIANVIKSPASKVDGLIVSNTTIERPEFLISDHKAESGGLSGKPLKDKSTEIIRHMYKLTDGMPIIGEIFSVFVLKF